MSAVGTAELVDSIGKFFRRYYDDEIKQLAQKYPQEQRSLYVDWNDVFQYNDREREIDAIADDVLAQPEQMQRLFEEALRQYDLPIDVSLGNAHVRFTNLPDGETYDIGGFSPSLKDGSLIALQGQIAKKTKVAPIPTEIAYECQLCGTLNRVPQSGHGFEEPHECKGCDRQGPFRENSDQSEKEDYQKIRLKQPPEQTDGGDGEHLDVRVRDDLVDCVEGGDRVTLVGQFVLEQPSKNSDQETYEMAVEGQAAEVEQTDFKEIEITPELEEVIERIAAGEYGDPIEQFIGSIAPTLEGLDDEKEALTLALFSGVSVEHDDGTRTRGDIHILMIGDPGTGKTTLLEAISEIAPRSVRASGGGASKAGMTAAAVRDEFGDGTWALEAGALVVGDQGVATIDEIDKLDDGVEEAMHDAMASQKVSVNKAGINTTLPSRTSVIAGGNPKYGRFDQYEPYAEQIEIGPTLLSRFDLTFTLTDQPDEDRDRTIASSKIESKEAAKQQSDEDDAGKAELAKIAEQHDLEPLELIRGYIAYAKRNVDPAIEDDEVAQKIEDSYVGLRMANGDDEDAPVPITARKLDGFIRLSEASARARLSETVEMQDVMRAKRLIGSCLQDIGVDEETGEFDTDIVEAGTSQSQRDRIKNLKDLIKEMQNESDRRQADKEKVIETAIDDLGIDKRKAEHEIDKLKTGGEVYERETGWIRVVE